MARYLFKLLKVVLPVLAVLGGSISVSAHSLDQSYVFFQADDQSLTGRVETPLDDLFRVLPDLDTSGDGTIDATEFVDGALAFFDLIQETLALSNDGQSLNLVAGDASTLKVPGAEFGQLSFSIPDLSPVPETLDIQFDLADRIGSGHSGYVLIESNTRTGVDQNETFISLVASPGRMQSLNLGQPDRWAVFGTFIWQGVLHIWLGFDHLIFLAVLLLPSVLQRTGAGWVPAEDARSAFIRVLKLVTAFTVSHSITLSLATLGIVTLPSAIVETVIALSIVAIALSNIFPQRFGGHGLLVVFIFGLFHGFGFAAVLAPLGIDPAAKFVTLLGFNLGVELGQVAVVAVLFPLLFSIRKWPQYPAAVVRAASFACLLIGSFWALERGATVVTQATERLSSSS